MAKELTEDEIQAQTTRAAAIAMGNWMIEAGITGKRIDQIRMNELENMAIAAIGGWTIKRAEFLAKERRADPIELG